MNSRRWQQNNVRVVFMLNHEITAWNIFENESFWQFKKHIKYEFAYKQSLLKQNRDICDMWTTKQNFWPALNDVGNYVLGILSVLLVWNVLALSF